MKKVFILIFSICSLSIGAGGRTDNEIFKGYFINKEYDVYFRMDLYKNNIIVPGQDIFGELPGFFGDMKDSRKWLITSAKIIYDDATLTITNDYGSEDLTATFTKKNDSIYILKQNDGSQLKIARERKWVKIPKTIEFVKQKNFTN